jgi:hypothetical protein
MPKVEIKYPSSLNAQTTFERVKDYLDKDEGILKMDSSIQSQFDDGQKKGSLTGKKFSAQVSVVEAGAGSQVVIEVDLPFMFAAFKGQVKSTIEKKLEKVLA